MHKDLTIVMPSFGECESLQKLLPEILDCSSYALSRIIVVDDNSTDGTSEFIKENSFNCDIICINRLDRTGLSSAVIEGVMAADTKYIAVMDSDGQHDPSDLFAMHELIKNRDLDIIIGSRFVTNQQLDNHVGFRHTISKFGNRAANFLLKKELSDPMTGFFVFKRKIFVDQAHLIKPMGFKILLDFLFNIRNEAIKLEEFQINFRSRSAGESKIAMDVIFSFVDQILNKATIVCLPSYREGFPKVLLEAASCAKPIVTTDVPGCRQAVENNLSGLLVPAKNPQALADAMEKLIHNKSLCKIMGARGLERVNTELSQNIIANKTINLWEKILDKSY